ncbi:MAG: ferritin-like domain-containing protein [Myxococcota bacterium]
MNHGVEMGMNRTGMDMAPQLSDEMLENAQLPTPSGDEGALAQMRTDYIDVAEPLGSVPPPLSLKGAATAAMEMLKGHRPEVLLDKLSERLAFERTAVRLYDALIQKCLAVSPHADIPPLEELRAFRDEEARHLELVAAAVRGLGADPTTVSPCADTAAVSAMGVVQVLSDPRTTVAQCLQALLTAEAADNDGWLLLIKLADVLGLEDLVEQFQGALHHEDKHLEHVRLWLSEMVINEAMVI